MLSDSSVIINLLIYAWCVLCVIQSYLAYGTAYRHTRDGGDSGVALWGWLIVFNLAALIPGMGIYLWHKSKAIA